MTGFLNALDAVVRERADAPAVIAPDVVLSYAALLEASERAAARLRAAGVRRGDVVAIALGRSGAHVVSMLACWRAGAAFLPVDPAAPEARVREMIAECRARVVLKRRTDAAVPSGKRPDDPVAEAIDTRSPPLGTLDEDLAYVIYTSGSTGRPKGVRVSHRGIVPVLRAQIRAFGLAPGKRALFALSSAFDASISDIGTALLSGATLVVPEGGPSPILLAETLRVHRVTHADLPPAVLPQVRPESLPACLETVVIGGEVCPPSAVRAWARRVRVVNVYGPTEATICTSLGACDPRSWEEPLLGDPLDHVRYAIDAGELLIAGPALALGYVDRPELEAARFVVREGQRWYRTGDRVRRRDDGAYVFVGRLDRQIKLHGKLVCPEEIESALRALPDVQDAAVVEERRAASAQSREGAPPSLAGLVVLRPGARTSISSLRERLGERLPRWMIPSLAVVDSLAAARDPGVAGKVRGVEAAAIARDARVQAIAGAFSEVLGVADVGDDDDVFDLGADSIGVLQIVTAAQLAGVAIDPSTVAAARTPRAIAQAPAAEDLSLAAIESMAAGVAPPPETRRGRSGGDWLVTGATGFLGRRLLPEILRRTDARVHCIVRAPDDRRARERLGGAGLDPRVVAHAGDVAAPEMGLPPERWRALADAVGHVVHAAASVSLALPFDALARANAGGAAEVARFVGAGADKTLHHVSSLAVLASTTGARAVIGEETCLAPEERVLGAYPQSKAIAEAVLRRCVADLRVVRPGLLTGDTATGEATPRCPLVAFLRALATLGCVPDADFEALRVDVTPVDRAASAIADAFASPARIPVLHVASERGASLGDLVRAVRRRTQVRVVSPEQFLREARARLPREDALAVVASAYRVLGTDAHRGADLFLHTGRVFRSADAAPEPSDVLLDRYVAAALDRGDPARRERGGEA